MRPAEFDYSRPATLDEALAAMRGGAVPMAGGQTLLQSLRLRRREPAAIVDLSHVAELDDRVTLERDRIRIGALVTHARLMKDPLIVGHLPWLAEAAARIGDVQVRNRGTTLGNLCWADPRANMAVALLASDAFVTVADPKSDGAIRVPVSSFFTGFQETVLDGRLAVAIEVPVPYERTGAYLEQSRQQQDLALVNVCVVRGHDFARIAVGGLHIVPILIDDAAMLISGADPSAAARLLARRLRENPTDLFWNHLAGADYRFELAEVLLCRALETCGSAVHA